MIGAGPLGVEARGGRARDVSSGVAWWALLPWRRALLGGQRFPAGEEGATLFVGEAGEPVQDIHLSDGAKGARRQSRRAVGTAPGMRQEQTVGGEEMLAAEQIHVRQALHHGL